MFLDFHSNTTLTYDMEILIDVLMTPGANDAAILGAEILPQCEFIDMVQLVLFLFTIAIGNLSEK